MGLLNALFSKDEVVKSLSKGADEAFYTKEERGSDFLQMLKSYEPFKLAQRLLMLLIAVPFVLGFVVALITYPFSADAALAVSTMTKEHLGEPMKWVTIFYFGGGAVEGSVKAWSKREKK